MELKSYAKINLSLDLIGKREDGYHELDMLIQSISLCDIIELNKIKEDKIIFSNSGGLENNINNDGYKAAKLIKDYYNIKHGYSINIDKKIPIASGLGGGSSNAATIIKGILELENIKPDYSVIDKLALQIGTEVLYFLRGSLARVKGKGDIIETFDNYPDMKVLIVNPNYKISTKSVYSSLSIKDYNKSKNTEKLIECILKQNYQQAYSFMHNDLQNKVSEKNPEISDIIRDMYSLGAKKSMMSGSGPTVFGIFDDKILLEKAKEKFKIDGNKVFMTNTVGGAK